MPYIDEAYLKREFGITSRRNTAAHPFEPSLQKTDEGEAAFRKISNLVKVRDRAVLEVKDRLRREEFSDAAIEYAVNRALRCGFLDDGRFAETLIRSRLSQGKGIAGIARELKKLGVDPDAIPGFPEDFLQNSRNQSEAALALLLRKPPQAKNQLQAAYAKLIRAGYASSIAQDAAKRWFALKNENEE